LLNLISTKKPSILADTETWLTPDIRSSEIFPTELGYNAYHKDRPSRHGGVLLAVTNLVSSVELSSDCEIIWAKLSIPDSPIFIAAYYRPHVNDSFSLVQLDLSLHKLHEMNKQGNKQLPSNYRPILLTSIAYKLFEQIINSNIMQHIEVNHILSEHQYDFHHSLSCETLLITLLHDLYQCYDIGIQTDIQILLILHHINTHCINWNGLAFGKRLKKLYHF